MNSDLHVAIVGGGIGGLTAALCLAGQGHKVTVLEQAQAFEEVGAGIQLSPNCTHVLHALGLESGLRSQAFVPEATEFRDWRSGNIITSSRLGDEAERKYGAPYYHIHRADLLDILHEAAQANPAIDLKLESPVSSFSQNDEGVQLTVNEQTIKADVVIGADGIHSVIRQGLWGDDQPRFTGNIAWRALIPANRLAEGLVKPVASVWWGPGKHLVHYYVRGGELVNCVGVVEKTGWEIESWTERGDSNELREDFAGWHPDVEALLEAVDDASLHKWALFDRRPMPRWGKDRVTLLGDACHPMLPFMAQGAAMSIEDAAMLATCLDGKDISGSLATYEGQRRPRTARVQNGSKRNSRVFHLSGAAALVRNAGARFAGRSTMEWLYSYKPRG